MARAATCACGQLIVSCEGDPTLVSVCHCLACQRRKEARMGSLRFFGATRYAPAGTHGATRDHPTVDSMSPSIFVHIAAQRYSGNHAVSPR